MSRKKNTQPFVSKADTKELREYQQLASKYPPIEHERLLKLSRRFIAGRDAMIEIEESQLIRAVIGDDWSEDSLRVHEQAIKNAFDRQIDLMNGETSVFDLINEVLPESEQTAHGLYVHRHDNIFAAYPWYPFTSIATVLGWQRDMQYEEFEVVSPEAFKAVMDAVEAIVPGDTPKDVLDRWKEDRASLSKRYMLTVSALKLDEQGERRRKHLSRQAAPALEEIVNHNLQLAMSRVGKFMKNNARAQRIGVSELIGAANVGLVLGARQFDPNQNKRFSTYAAFHIDGQLYDILNSEDGNCGIKGISLHEQKQSSTIASVKRTFQRRYGREPSLSELQSITGISAGLINKRVNMPAVRTQNIYAPVTTNQKKSDDGSGSVLLADTLEAEKNVEDIVSDKAYHDMIDALKHEIFALPENHRKLVVLRTGIVADDTTEVRPEPMSASRAASTLGMNPKKAEELYEEAMDMLKSKMELRGYTSDMIL